MIEAEEKENKLKQFLDGDGRVVIRKENGKMLLIAEVDIGNKLYCKGVAVDSSKALMKYWVDFIDSSVKATRRLRDKLVLERK